ncbi:hypothetical protein DRO59_00715 [Candidatus Bathyarchaeota archaeon]|nr:MAG: hypothetical protein DRO59_00715 [Candidatus Bathyarchaeota archaeon]
MILLATTVVKGRLKKFDVNLDKVLDRNCKLCCHVNVCAVYRAVKPLLGNWKEQDRPFEAEQLAKICKNFKLAVDTN